jgi:toxin YoeB
MTTQSGLKRYGHAPRAHTAWYGRRDIAAPPSRSVPMLDTDLQYLSDADGSVQAVVIPIDAWKRLASQLETYHLLQSPEMHRRLRGAKSRANGISFDESIRQIEYDACGFEDLAWWNKQDHDRAVRIVQLIRDIQSDPFDGPGRPTPLLYDLEGCWTRRVEGSHRIVYQVLDDKVRILACRYHEVEPVSVEQT